MEISAHIDWISVTVSNDSELKLPSVIRAQEWKETKGKNGYTVARKFVSGVLEMSNPDRDDMGTHIVYSGKTISRLESIGIPIMSVLRFHVNENHKLSRIDLAIDVKSPSFEISELQRAIEDNSVVTDAKSFTHINTLKGKGETLYVGSQKKRKKLLRIYDKSAEMGVDGEWIRIELEVHAPAVSEVAHMIAKDKQNERSTFQKIITGFCDFPTVKGWKDVMGSESVSIRVDREGKEDTTRIWLLNQCAPSLAKQLSLDSSFLSVFMEQVNLALGDLKEESG